jgi:hypothetical protein
MPFVNFVDQFRSRGAAGRPEVLLTLGGARLTKNSGHQSSVVSPALTPPLQSSTPPP